MIIPLSKERLRLKPIYSFSSLNIRQKQVLGNLSKKGTIINY